jgi:hypothetical protein
MEASQEDQPISQARITIGFSRLYNSPESWKAIDWNLCLNDSTSTFGALQASRLKYFLEQKGLLEIIL